MNSNKFPDNNLLTQEEEIIMSLRALYKQYDYAQYKTSRFEEYALYNEHKAFLPSGDMITFTGVNGKLMALRPDVTLSIVRDVCRGELRSPAQKLYYNENVFRSNGNEIKEQMQVGLECIGNIDIEQMGEVLILAGRSLETLSKMMGGVSGEPRWRLDIGLGNETDDAISELEALLKILKGSGIEKNVYLDFTIANDISYYDGLIFQGFIEGIPSKVLSGGRYDMLMRKFNISSGAIGFAVYLDVIKSPASAGESTISIALPKGRLGEKAYAILEEAGYGCPEIKENSRRLIFESPEKKVRYFWVKPSDVAIYVERGVADVGIVGKDILLEQSPDVYELLDMGIGKCKICVAGEKDKEIPLTNSTLRVATIFPNIARNYFEKQGRDIDIIKLHGSIEIAPILDLSDVIVDIVETGKTLQENDLEPIETITDISARLIANKVSYRFKNNSIMALVNNCRDDRPRSSEL